MAETSRFVGPILKFLFPNISDETLAVCHAIIRKTAHFTEYALLAFFAIRALARSSIASLRNLRYLLPLILVALVASMDEFNQSFESSRTGSFRDVLLDFTGGLTMIVLMWILGKRSPHIAQNAPSGSLK